MTAVIPLPQTRIAQICSDEHRFFMLTADDIQTYSSQQESVCYIPFVCVDVSHHHSNRLAHLLANDAIEHYFTALGRMGIPLTQVYFRDIAEYREGMTEAIMRRTHKFHDIRPPDLHDHCRPGDGSQGMVVAFDQADSALVSAYYAGKRACLESLTPPSWFARIPPLNLAFYDIPGDGIYGPVLDGHYLDREADRLVAIPPLLTPGQKQRGRPPKQPA